MEKVKKPDETLKKLTHCENSDLKKSKHRFADSKYRHNVQFLYRLLKGNSYENVTKDVLLTTVSDDIKRMQNDIIFLAGMNDPRKNKRDKKEGNFYRKLNKKRCHGARHASKFMQVWLQKDENGTGGSQKLDKYNEKFLEVVDIGENIWKKEKNPIVWWNKMQTVLKNVPRF